MSLLHFTELLIARSDVQSVIDRMRLDAELPGLRSRARDADYRETLERVVGRLDRLTSTDPVEEIKVDVAEAHEVARALAEAQYPEGEAVPCQPVAAGGYVYVPVVVVMPPEPLPLPRVETGVTVIDGGSHFATGLKGGPHVHGEEVGGWGDFDDVQEES